MNKKVIDLLNQARAREISAIMQYMSQHYELEDQDYGKLAKMVKKIAIVEMKHAEALAERILFLGGQPTSKPDTDAFKKGETISQMLKTDIDLEVGAVKLYNESALICAQENDMVTKDLFESLLKDEDGHENEFESIKDHVDTLGQAYLATLVGQAAD